jgi:hypothetical protein
MSSPVTALPTASELALLALAVGLRLGPTGLAERWWRCGLYARSSPGCPALIDGHERLLLAPLLGAPAADPGPANLPLLRALWEGFGAMGAGPAWAFTLNLAAGALVPLLLRRALLPRAGPRAALWAALLACAHPGLCAWSTSPWNVNFPIFLTALSFLLPSAPAALLLGLAAAMRPEWGLFGLLRGAPGLLGLGVALWTLSSWGLPGQRDWALQLRANLPVLDLAGPPVLLLGLLSLRRRLGRALWGGAIAMALLAALFDDMGSRHLLGAGLLACAALGLAVQRWGSGLALLGLLGMGPTWLELARGRSPAEVPRGAPPAGCLELSEEPILAGQPRPSHLRLLAGQLQAPCLLWMEEEGHRRWSSRGLSERALRMRRLYRLEPVAQGPGPAGLRVWYRLERP